MAENEGETTETVTGEEGHTPEVQEGAAPEGTPAPEAVTPEAPAPQDAPSEDGDADTGELAANIRSLGDTSEHLGDVVAFLDDMKVGDKDIAKIFGEALKAGDISKIDQALLKERIGETKAKLVNTAIGNYVAEAKAQIEARDKIIVDVMGSSEAFKTAVEWANDDKNMSEADRTALDGMIKQGGLQAKLAAQHLKTAYEASPGTNVERGTPLNGDKTSTGNGIEPITRKQYTELMNSTPGWDEHKIAEIKARRLAGMRAGI